MLMKQSLLYMILAITIGYMLISVIPQQVAFYTAPKKMFTLGEDSFNIESYTPDEDETLSRADNGVPETGSNETSQGFKEPSFLETSRLPELMKGWTLDIVIALSIYWFARRRLG